MYEKSRLENEANKLYKKVKNGKIQKKVHKELQIYSASS